MSLFKWRHPNHRQWGYGPQEAVQAPQNTRFVVTLKTADSRPSTRTRQHQELTRCLTIWFGAGNVTVEASEHG